MNIVLFSEDELQNNNFVVLSGRRAEHIISVHRAQPGKLLLAGVLDGEIGSAEVVMIGEEEVKLKFYAEKSPSSPLSVHLIVALQRPKTLKKIIQSATAAGVKKFTFIESWKVEKSYWHSPLLSQEKLYEQLILGLEQGVDTVLPEIEFKRRFKPFVEDELPLLIEGKFPVLFHPGSKKKFIELPIENRESVLVFGPEGGFTDYEIKKFIECSFVPCSLTERILRTEYAVNAALGKFF